MYGCILVVGGGMKFSGIATWLQNRISLQIPYLYRAGIFCCSFRRTTNHASFVFRAIGYNYESTRYGFCDGCLEGSFDYVLFGDGARIVDFLERMGEIRGAVVERKSSIRVVKQKIIDNKRSCFKGNQHDFVT